MTRFAFNMCQAMKSVPEVLGLIKDTVCQI